MQTPTRKRFLPKNGSFRVFQLGYKLLTLIRQGASQFSRVVPEPLSDCNFHNNAAKPREMVRA